MGWRAGPFWPAKLAG